MINSTPEYEYKQANTKDIFVDPLYQRDLDNSKVSKIVRDWNPYLVNAVKVSWRDGKLWVFDGQHTIAACKAKRGGRDCMVDCKVFYGLTRLDEMSCLSLRMEQQPQSRPERNTGLCSTMAILTLLQWFVNAR